MRDGTVCEREQFPMAETGLTGERSYMYIEIFSGPGNTRKFSLNLIFYLRVNLMQVPTESDIVSVLPRLSKSNITHC